MNVRMLAAVMLSACSPILTPVVGRQPLIASSNPPRIVWLFDQSGSMEIPISPCAAVPTCGTPGNRCPPSCPTRETLFRAGIDTMAALLPPSVPNIPIKFPIDALCAPPLEPVPDAFPPVDAGSSSPRVPSIAATELHSLLATYLPIGGTPTAASLRHVASLAPLLRGSETIVVLVTDGLPNCNDANPYNLCAQPTDLNAIAACRCTTSSCTASLCSKGCLDDLGAVSASHLLAQQGMSLMVIGLGADLQSGIGTSTLGAMEIALPAPCTSSADCNGRSCNPDGVCADRIFMAASLTDFDAPARRLARAVQVSDRCTWWLPRQVAAADLTVEIGAEVLDPAEWTLKGDQEQRVVISGAACDRLIAGTESVTLSLPPSN